MFLYACTYCKSAENYNYCFSFQELYHYVEEYVSVYEADDDEEWRLVISEVTAFMEVIPVIMSRIFRN